MIESHPCCQIRHLFTEKQLARRPIARALQRGLNPVRQRARRESLPRARRPQRSSQLDPVPGESLRRLEQHADSAPQVFQRVKERGCPGRSTILRAFVRQVASQAATGFSDAPF